MYNLSVHTNNLGTFNTITEFGNFTVDTHAAGGNVFFHAAA